MCVIYLKTPFYSKYISLEVTQKSRTTQKTIVHPCLRGWTLGAYRLGVILSTLSLANWEVWTKVLNLQVSSSLKWEVETYPSVNS